MLNVNDPMFEEWVQNIVQQESDFSENDDSDKDLPRDLRQNISRILNKPIQRAVECTLQKRVRCTKCPRTQGKKKQGDLYFMSATYLQHLRENYL